MKRNRAFVENRRNQILNMMKENPQVRVNDLARILDASLVTIRRDLQYLEDQKRLVRTYGGAVPVKGTDAVKEEKDELALYRTLIAKLAASFVSERDSLFINTSKNALQTLEYITSSNVTVITNNGKAMNCDRAPGVNVVLTGGELRHPKDAMVGDFAIRNLQTVYAKKAFVGCSGVSAETGMTTEIFNEVSINELMINHASQEVYLLADHTKIGRNSSFISCPIEKIKYLITDEKAPEEALNQIRERGVIVYQVHKEDRDCRP